MKLVNLVVKCTQLTSKRSVSIIPNDSHASLALFSLSSSITTNLALENHIAELINTRPDLNVLLLWISEPCIVYGRHQNPWLECDVKRARQRGVKVVRRYSGGGCVYHDRGNLNISFLTNRLKFDRKINLNLIKDSLQDSSLFEHVDYEITPRHDIYVRYHDRNEIFKITGSAARLAHKFSYHHCTLLYNVDLDNMSLLKSSLAAHIVGTKATPSVPAKCVNMKTYRKPIASDNDMQRLIEAICRRYWMLNKQTWSSKHLFEYVDAEAIRGAGVLEKNARELESWQHRFGMTPKFSIQIPDFGDVNIENGIIADLKTPLEDTQTRELLIGCRLDSDELKNHLTGREDIFNQNTIILKEFLNKHLI